MKVFLNKAGNELLIKYLNGNPMDEKDLERAVTSKAKLLVLLNRKNGIDA